MVMTSFRRPPQPLSSRRSSRFTALRQASCPSISADLPLRATVRIRVILNPLMPVVWYNGIVCFIFPFPNVVVQERNDSKQRLKSGFGRYPASVSGTFIFGFNSRGIFSMGAREFPVQYWHFRDSA